MVEKKVVQSAVHSEHGRVWVVTIIIMGINNSELHAITKLVCAVTFTEGSITSKVGAIF